MSLYHYPDGTPAHDVTELFPEVMTSFSTEKIKQIQIRQSDFYGKGLFIDNVIQSCEYDQILYHKTMVRPFENFDKANVLVVGVGPGGLLPFLRDQNVVHIDNDPKAIKVYMRDMYEWHQDYLNVTNTTYLDYFLPEFKTLLKTRKWDGIFVDFELCEDRIKEEIDIFLSCLDSLTSGGWLVRCAGGMDPRLGHTWRKVYSLFNSHQESVSWACTQVMFGCPWVFVGTSKSLYPFSSSGTEIFTE